MLQRFIQYLDWCHNSKSNLSHPALVVKHLKLQQHFGHTVVIAYDALGLGCIKDAWVLLEELHGLLDSPVQLPSPEDLPCDGREASGDGRVHLLLVVDS